MCKMLIYSRGLRGLREMVVEDYVVLNKSEVFRFKILK